MIRLAFSLFSKLIAKSINDRYLIGQVLEHPWITRTFVQIPLTFEEDCIKDEKESKFKSTLITLLFVSSNLGKIRLNERYKKKVK